jgi:hypothetical protein
LPAIRRRSAVDASMARRSRRSLARCDARRRFTSVHTSGSWHTCRSSTAPTVTGTNSFWTSPRRSVICA